MSNIEKQYQGILRKLILYGSEKEDRTGTGTLSYFGEQIRHNMEDGFPLLTTKKMAIKTMMTELKWFLKGDTNIKYLLENGCHIWTGDAIKNYEKHNGEINGGPHITKEEYFEDLILTDDKFAQKWGELGPIYGKQWRDWKSQKFDVARGNGYLLQVDQIAKVIVDLKKNPDSRRLMVSAWNVGEMDEMVLPPCHYGFQVYTRELDKFERSHYLGIPKGQHFLDEVLDKYNIPKRVISLMWNQRSVDSFLGLPFNIASYATLLQLIADECNMIAGELIGNLGDVHLYKNHIQQAKEQISREPYKLPTIKLTNVKLLEGEFDYEIKNYESHPSIKAPLSN
jgi:thymidylate synthase